jgi:hypothetical protein
MDLLSLKEPGFQYIIDEEGAAVHASWESVDSEAAQRAVRQVKKAHGSDTTVRLTLMPAPAAILQGRCAPNDLIERLHAAFLRGLNRIGIGENADWIATSGGGQGSDWRASLSEVARRAVRYLAGFDIVFYGTMSQVDVETEYRATIAADLLAATQAVMICMRGDYYGMDFVLATCVREIERILQNDPAIERQPGSEA